MTRRTTPWPAGVPCWAVLDTPDLAAARAFYAAVLGWEFQEDAAAGGGAVIAQVDGLAAAGLRPSRPAKAPAAWTLVLASDDADAAAASIAASGGTVLEPPSDIGPTGRLLIAADPSGAVFGVWQAGSRIGASHVNAPGGLTWEDLRSTHPAAAQAFYSAVFGFTLQPVEMAGPDYRTFALGDGPPLGGMGGLMDSERAESFWLCYFGVADAAAAATAARTAGGVVLRDAFTTPYGRMAGIADPAGAWFWVVETTDQPRPDWTD